MNRFVSFLPDDLFLAEVKRVMLAYDKMKDIIDKDLYRNCLDQTKQAFDRALGELSNESWETFEKLRQRDKVLNSAVGIFHQNILGACQGWINGGTGPMDLESKDGKIFVEVKNKHNTMNAAQKRGTWSKLVKCAKDHPDAMVYVGVVNGTKDQPYYATAKESKDVQDRIKIVSGQSLYTMVTGCSDALPQVIAAIPKAMAELRGGTHDLKTMCVFRS